MRDTLKQSPRATATDSRRWSDLYAVALIIVGVSLIYGTRLATDPLIGEETRWATAAREMLSTGDWIVPRQQGQIFAERPPMTMWLMAVGGWLRGDVDAVAVRLPSVIAVVLTSLLIYGYARAFASSSTALIASLIFATSGQVLQIGRRGESEAVFTLFVSASLLLWHLSYIRRCRPLLVWTLGFSFAALAALVKGPQAPVYFGAISVGYLILNGDLRYLFRWQTLVGALAFVAIIGVWQIPFYRATDWSSVHATWAGLAGDRIRLSGILKHAFSYPIETFTCLLPWSPMLLALLYRGVREWLREKSQVTFFLLTASVIAYPTVWMASAARGRYFMPLYPVVAVLIALLIECCSHAQRGSGPYLAWRRFVLSWALVIGACAAAIAGSSVLPQRWSLALYEPAWFALLFAAFACGAIRTMWLSTSARTTRPAVPVIALATAAGISAAGLMVNVNAALWSNPTDEIVELTDHIPTGTRLVSLNEIDHRFAYYYREPIDQIAWPQTVSDIPSNVDYFLFVRHWNDTTEMHFAGRGRTVYTTPGTLPFEWQEVATVCPDRQVNTPTATTVVLGRVVRPLRAMVSDVSKPQSVIARRPTTAFK